MMGGGGCYDGRGEAVMMGGGAAMMGGGGCHDGRGRLL